MWEKGREGGEYPNWQRENMKTLHRKAPAGEEA